MQRGAGTGSSITDEEFVAAGARLLTGADDVWAEAEMILKVKEPVPEARVHVLTRSEAHPHAWHLVHHGL